MLRYQLYNRIGNFVAAAIASADLKHCISTGKCSTERWVNTRVCVRPLVICNPQHNLSYGEYLDYRLPLQIQTFHCYYMSFKGFSYLNFEFLWFGVAVHLLVLGTPMGKLAQLQKGLCGSEHLGGWRLFAGAKIQAKTHSGNDN